MIGLPQTKSEYRCDTDLLLDRHLQLPDDGEGKADNDDVKNHVDSSDRKLCSTDIATCTVECLVPLQSDWFTQGQRGCERGDPERSHYPEADIGGDAETLLDEEFHVQDQDRCSEGADGSSPEPLRRPERLIVELAMLKIGVQLSAISAETMRSAYLERDSDFRKRQCADVFANSAIDSTCGDQLATASSTCLRRYAYQ